MAVLTPEMFSKSFVGHTASSVPVADRLKRLRLVQQWARRLDSQFSIPGTRIRFGWDSIVGLLPGAGDTATAIVGLWLVYEAQKVGLPKSLVAQMLGNILVDFAAGSVPIVGDLFDMAFKAHLRNARLLEDYMTEHSLIPGTVETTATRIP